MPADGRTFRYRILIQRTAYFPLDISQVSLIGSAVVEADGKTITVESMASSLGLTKLELSNLKAAQGRLETTVEVEFEWSSDRKRAALMGSSFSARDCQL